MGMENQAPTYPTYREEDFFIRLPEVEFDTREILDYGMKNMRSFGNLQNNIAQSNVKGSFIPSELIAGLNDCIHYSQRTDTGLKLYFEREQREPEPLFSHPVLFVLHSDGSAYNLHTDTMRPSALNFLLLGDPDAHTTCFEWRDSTIPLRYNVNEAVMFNTQIPHRVQVEEPNLRILLTVRCSMAYQQFIMFREKGFIEIG